MDFPALALLEFSSIAAGIEAGDAMVKRAPVSKIQTGTVQPGHYLVLVVGDVASVEEAVAAGKEVGQAALRDALFLPNVHPDVVIALGGRRQAGHEDALGIIETTSVASAILAADAGVKGAEVSLLQLRLADGLGGKGLVYFHGLVADVETAVAIATISAQNQLVKQRVIPQLHTEMWENVNGYGRFGQHFGWDAA
ncbi:MAG: BMC domain-containing protein [Ardenticatenaceae bacterium]|nr:BMC domain-containing protein [Anaerolineales bacterium]MCB8939563.1 BMC domain-containing protein [Ardenticatenaceae bacterium]MCB8975014.1 BMC domain-containing protein [Ardenticatenaceae bacterium]